MKKINSPVVTVGMSKEQTKKTLSDLTQNPFKLGRNMIKVLKISDKYVEIEELFNGHYQKTPRKLTIDTALQYYGFRKHQFEFWPENELHNRLDLQTNQYRVQLENIDDLIGELENHLIVAIKDALKYIKGGCAFKIKFTMDVIEIELETGNTITLEPFVLNNGQMRIIVSAEKSPRNIINLNQVKDMAVMNGLCELLYYKDEITTDFLNIYERFQLCRKNLKKIWVEPSKDIEAILQEDLYNFIVNAPEGLTYSYKLKPIAQYERRFEIEKVSRIKTVYKIIATSSENEFIEFEDKMNKISSQIEQNVKKIGLIVESHNY